jgi:hypothetical protein
MSRIVRLRRVKEDHGLELPRSVGKVVYELLHKMQTDMRRRAVASYFYTPPGQRSLSDGRGPQRRRTSTDIGVVLHIGAMHETAQHIRTQVTWNASP